jgi:uncharacterized protein YbjQ (UPF0145 family)
VKNYVDNPEANQQINLIADLLAKGCSDDAVADHLKAHRIPNLAGADGHWTVDDISKIRIDFALTPIRRYDIERVLLTTEMFLSLPIKKRLEIVSAEAVFGMNLFRDFFAGLTDVFGGRSQATQKVLRDSRRTVLYELKKEALQVGGNAVIGVDLKYSEFSGQGKSMLFVVATGTAVVIENLQT